MPPALPDRSRHLAIHRQGDGAAIVASDINFCGPAVAFGYFPRTLQNIYAKLTRTLRRPSDRHGE
jgi:hypothetical protein